MYGKASLHIPHSGELSASYYGGLSDELAMLTGRIAARTLSEEEGFVQVKLESGEEKVIGYCTLTGRVTIGRLVSRELPDLPIEVSLDSGSSVHIGLDEHGRPELWDHSTI